MLNENQIQPYGRNFLNLGNEISGTEKIFSILPVPYESTTCFMKGTKNAPAAIIKASSHLETFDEEYLIEFENHGAATYISPECSSAEAGIYFPVLKQRVNDLLNADKFPVVIGGEHSLSFPVVQAVREKYSDIFVIQFDAHGDLRDKYTGTKDSHACVMRRIHESGIPFASFGVRSITREEVKYIGMNNIPYRYAYQLNKNSDIMDIVSTIDVPVYITFDFDAFDPGVIPALGTPVSGGLQWYQVLDMFKQILGNCRIAGIDFVEFMPFPHTEGPAFSCAQFILKILNMLLYTKSFITKI